MGLKAGDVRITGRTMDHAKGAWAGMRPNWWTATHEATGFSVTWHECCDVAQHKQRDAALACLDLMIETMGAKCPPLAVTAPQSATHSAKSDPGKGKTPETP